MEAGIVPTNMTTTMMPTDVDSAMVAGETAQVRTSYHSEHH